MSEEIIAISFDALFAKSKVYITKALTRKAERDLEEYQLWASLALELLGKAALAQKHPCLVADPNHTDSMFVAAGISITTDVKTIGAKTVFERLKSLVGPFDEPVRKFCQSISERRNSELHSGDLPFKTMQLEAWEAQFWYACSLILSSFGSSFEVWIGSAEAETPNRIVQAKRHATFALVMSKIEEAKARFFAMSQKDREAAIFDAQNRPPSSYSSFFDYLNEHEWPQVCPACKSGGLLAGDRFHEEVTENDIGHSLWESVERTYGANEFLCPVCRLQLSGSEELEAASINENHTELEEREVDHEPEYGNC
jgi:hypothetical protein